MSIPLCFLINSLSEGKFPHLKLKFMKYFRARSRCEIIFEAPADKIALKDEIIDYTLKILPAGIEYSIAVDCINLTAEAVAPFTVKFISEKFFALSAEAITIDAESFAVSINIDSNLIEFAASRGLREALKEAIENEFLYSPKIALTETNKEFTAPIEAAAKAPERILKLSGVEKFIGEEVEGHAQYISDCRKESDGVTLTGRISGLKKIDRSNQLTENNRPKANIHRFILTDFSGAVSAVIFETKTNSAKLDQLENNEYVVARGAITVNDYGVSFRIKSLSYCDEPAPPRITEHKSEPPVYRIVKPQKIASAVQSGLLSLPHISDYIKNNTFVVFDLETTGMRVQDEIVEIGAVKIVDGEITESFITLVKASVPIGAEASAVNGITDKMLENAPEFKDIAQDFFKFTYGAVLVAHNAAFDMSFLTRQGLPLGYPFNNAYEDTITLAREKAVSRGNYKLATLLKKFGIINDNAHRALSDALATAKLFLELHKITSKIPS